MLSSAETQMLVGGLGMLGVGIASLISAVLVRRGHPTITKWFGSSANVYLRMGIFATVYGLLILGRFVVPERYFGIYARFFLASAILFPILLFVIERRNRRAR